MQTRDSRRLPRGWNQRADRSYGPRAIRLRCRPWLSSGPFREAARLIEPLFPDDLHGILAGGIVASRQALGLAYRTRLSLTVYRSTCSMSTGATLGGAKMLRMTPLMLA